MPNHYRFVVPVVAVIVLTTLIAIGPTAQSSQLPSTGGYRDLAIFQVRHGELTAVSYEFTTRLNGDVWFSVGPFVAGQPLILDYPSAPEKTVYASLAAQPKKKVPDLFSRK